MDKATEAQVVAQQCRAWLELHRQLREVGKVAFPQSFAMPVATDCASLLRAAEQAVTMPMAREWHARLMDEALAFERSIIDTLTGWGVLSIGTVGVKFWVNAFGHLEATSSWQ